MYFPISGATIAPFYLVGLGFIIGILGGFFGVGGSFLAGPALFVAGVPMNFVVGTDLLHIVGKSMVAARKHGILGNIDIRLAAVMVAATSGGSEVGVQGIEAQEDQYLCGHPGYLYTQRDRLGQELVEEAEQVENVAHHGAVQRVFHEPEEFFVARIQPASLVFPQSAAGRILRRDARGKLYRGDAAQSSESLYFSGFAVCRKESWRGKLERGADGKSGGRGEIGSVVGLVDALEDGVPGGAEGEFAGVESHPRVAGGVAKN